MPSTIILRPEDRHTIDLSALPRLWTMKNPGRSREARDVRDQMRTINREVVRFWWSLVFRNTLK